MFEFIPVALGISATLAAKYSSKHDIKKLYQQKMEYPLHLKNEEHKMDLLFPNGIFHYLYQV